MPAVWLGIVCPSLWNSTQWLSSTNDIPSFWWRQKFSWLLNLATKGHGVWVTSVILIKAILSLWMGALTSRQQLASLGVLHHWFKKKDHSTTKMSPTAMAKRFPHCRRESGVFPLICCLSVCGCLTNLTQ